MMFWKPEHGCWFVHNTCFPDKAMKKRLGYPRRFQFSWDLIIYPTLRAFRKSIARKLPHLPAGDRPGTLGFCTSPERGKGRGSCAEIVVPMNAGHWTLVHEAVHGALAVARRFDWDPLDGSRGEESVVVVAEHIADHVTRSACWCRKEWPSIRSASKNR